MQLLHKPAKNFAAANARLLIPPVCLQPIIQLLILILNLWYLESTYAEPYLYFLLGTGPGPTSLTLFRVTPSNVSGIVNKNTGSANGDLTFR